MNPILLTLGDSIDKAFYAFDMWIFQLLGSIQNGFLTNVAKAFTTFGDENFIIPVVIFSIALCFFKRTRKYGFTILFAIIIGTVITNVIMKPMVLRIRPYNTLQGNIDYWAWYVGAGALSEADYSFPSGHTTGAFEIATAAFLCFRSDKKKIAWLFPILAAGTMISRVYLMVHYPSDVIGGMIVGILSAVLGYFLMKLVMKIKVLEKIDIEKLFKKGIPSAVAVSCIAIVVTGLFVYAFIPELSEGEDVARCSYTGDYSCCNAARVEDEKYHAIDGKEYCKIHWKELTGGTN